MTEKKEALNGHQEIGLKNVAYECNGDTDDVKIEIQPVKKDNGSYAKLFTFASALDGFLIFFGTIAAILHGSAMPFGLIIFSRITDTLIDHGRDIKQNSTTTIDINDEMATLASYYALLGAGAFVCSFLQTFCWKWTGARQIDRIRKAFFRAVVRQDATWFDANDPGEISNRLAEDLLIVQEGVGDKVGEVIQYVSRFLAGFVIAFVFSWELSLVVLAVLPALLLTAIAKGRLLASWTVKEQKAYAQSASVAQEVLSSIRTVVAFGGETKETQRYASSLNQAEKTGILKGVGLGIGLGLFRFFIFATYAIAFWYGSKMVSDKRLDGGDLLLVFFSLVLGASQIGQVGPYLEAMSNAKGAALTIFDIIETVPKVDVFDSEGDTSDINGNITFSSVSFCYPGRESSQVLKNLSFDIEKGKTVALVGESGCGKSTVTKLLQKCYPIDEGQILIDGISINDYNVPWLRQHIGVVTQEPVLFDATIKENILLGKIDATDNDIEMAAINANAHDFIKMLPLGYETLVGEGGAQLSGGQKQRIAIARALIRDPKILLLDEATSALDTQSEAVVQAALEKASVGRTTLIIAHRLSTVKKADEILVLADGEVAERGSHDELMALEGAYYDSVLIQTFVENEKGTDINDAVLKSGSFNELSQTVSHLMLSIDSLNSGNEDQKRKAKELEFALMRRLSSRRGDRKANKKSKKLKKPKDNDKDMGDLQPVGFGRLMSMNKKEWPYILVGCIGNILLGAVPIVMSLFVSGVLKTFTEADPAKIRSETETLSLVLCGFALIAGLSTFFSNFFLTKAGEKLTTRMRHLTFQALLKQEVSYFDDQDHSTSNLTARLATDAARIKGITGQRLGIVIEVTVTLIAGMTLAFVSGWKLTFLILAFMPMMILVGVLRGRTMLSSTAAAKEKLQAVTSFASEVIMNMRTVNSLGRESYFVDRFVAMTLPLYNASKKDKLNAAFFNGLGNSMMMFSSAATFRLGGYLVSQGDMQFHEIFRVYIAMVFAAMFSGIAVAMAPDFVKAKVSAARIFNLLDRQPAIICDPNVGKKMDAIEGNISFDKGQFCYASRPDVTVLSDFTLTIKPGTTCALVGESGSGKSTTISLIERFYDLMTGSLMIDGQNIRDLNLPWLRSQIGIVSQEPVLFSGSIKENILYGLNGDELSQITQSEIEAAAQVANIHHVINTFPEGYDTEVGGSSTRLSGGQKQRIAIARALVRNPKILLLDEATSALDSASEKAVQKALDQAMIGRTSVIIAHRLTTIQNCDVIAVVEDGQVIEKGAHLDLLEKKGAYYLLNRTQVE